MIATSDQLNRTKAHHRQAIERGVADVVKSTPDLDRPLHFGTELLTAAPVMTGVVIEPNRPKNFWIILALAGAT